MLPFAAHLLKLIRLDMQRWCLVVAHRENFVLNNVKFVLNNIALDIMDEWRN